MKPTLGIDFDGTVAHEGKFISPSIIPYEPMEDAKEALELLSKFFRIVIFSCRAIDPEGQKAIELYMAKYLLPYDVVTSVKPTAVFYIDNRAIRFETWKQVLKFLASTKVE